MQFLLIILFLLMIIQSITSMYQVKNYQKFINKITNKYSSYSSYEFYTDVSKGKLFKVVVAVVIDSDENIVDCYICSGLTVFTHFKQETSYKGLALKDFHFNKSQGRSISKVEETLIKIYSRKTEALTVN